MGASRAEAGGGRRWWIEEAGDLQSGRRETGPLPLRGAAHCGPECGVYTVWPGFQAQPGRFLAVQPWACCSPTLGLSVPNCKGLRGTRPAHPTSTLCEAHSTELGARQMPLGVRRHCPLRVRAPGSGGRWGTDWGGRFSEGVQKIGASGPHYCSPLMCSSHAPSPRAHIPLPASLPFLSPDSPGLVVHSDPRAVPQDLSPRLCLSSSFARSSVPSNRRPSPACSLCPGALSGVPLEDTCGLPHKASGGGAGGVEESRVEGLPTWETRELPESRERRAGLAMLLDPKGKNQVVLPRGEPPSTSLSCPLPPGAGPARQRGAADGAVGPRPAQNSPLGNRWVSAPSPAPLWIPWAPPTPLGGPLPAL